MVVDATRCDVGITRPICLRTKPFRTSRSYWNKDTALFPLLGPYNYPPSELRVLAATATRGGSARLRTVCRRGLARTFKAAARRDDHAHGPRRGSSIASPAAFQRGLQARHSGDVHLRPDGPSLGQTDLRPRVQTIPTDRCGAFSVRSYEGGIRVIDDRLTLARSRIAPGWPQRS